jgi:predicted ester cyclase
LGVSGRSRVASVATQQKVSFSGSSFMHLRNGKLHDGWNFFDFTAVVHQLRGN